MGLSEYQKSRAEHIQKGRPLKEKKKHTINKVSPKRSAKEKEAKEAGTDTGQDKWFEAKRKECKCKCTFCGAKTDSKNDEFYRRAIAHLLPKRDIKQGGFPSVATHDENWVELCWQCHDNFDRSMISWETLADSHEWILLSEKLHQVLPCVAEEERKLKLYSRLTELLYEKTTKK